MKVKLLLSNCSSKINSIDIKYQAFQNKEKSNLEKIEIYEKFISDMNDFVKSNEKYSRSDKHRKELIKRWKQHKENNFFNF